MVLRFRGGAPSRDTYDGLRAQKRGHGPCRGSEDMSHSLNSFKGGLYTGLYRGLLKGVLRGILGV